MLAARIDDNEQSWRLAHHLPRAESALSCLLPPAISRGHDLPLREGILSRIAARATEARLYTKNELPFITGLRRPLADILADLS